MKQLLFMDSGVEELKELKRMGSESVPQSVFLESVDTEVSLMEIGSGNYGCSHYMRRCKIRAPCCNEIFDCRHSHNGAKRREERMKSKASFLQTTEVGEATISSTADLARIEMSPPAADC